MKKIILSVSLILCAMAGLVPGARADETAMRSCSTSSRVFVQSFYDWYVIKKDKQPDIRGTEEALKQKKELFDSPLYKELMEDQNAAAKAPGELVGLDFDPFVNANGLIYNKYQTGKAICKGTTCRVPIYGIEPGKKQKFVVEAEVGTKNGRYFFTNFHYGKTASPANENLLSLLGELKKERRNTK